MIIVFTPQVVVVHVHAAVHVHVVVLVVARCLVVAVVVVVVVLFVVIYDQYLYALKANFITIDIELKWHSPTHF